MAPIKYSQNFLLDDEVIGITELDNIYQAMIHDTRGRYYYILTKLVLTLKMKWAFKSFQKILRIINTKYIICYIYSWKNFDTNLKHHTNVFGRSIELIVYTKKLNLI